LAILSKGKGPLGYVIAMQMLQILQIMSITCSPWPLDLNNRLTHTQYPIPVRHPIEIATKLVSYVY